MAGSNPIRPASVGTGSISASLSAIAIFMTAFFTTRYPSLILDFDLLSACSLGADRLALREDVVKALAQFLNRVGLQQ
jgi:hypothetical protein